MILETQNELDFKIGDKINFDHNGQNLDATIKIILGGTNKKQLWTVTTAEKNETIRFIPDVDKIFRYEVKLLVSSKISVLLLRGNVDI